MVFTAYVQMHG